jgi:hypothetical protein
MRKFIKTEPAKVLYDSARTFYFYLCSAIVEDELINRSNVKIYRNEQKCPYYR